MPSELAPEFESAIMPHLNAAYNLARWLLRSDQDAADIVHDSFLRAHRYFATFDGSDGRGWLFRIVRNACFDFLRNNKSQPASDDEIDQHAQPDPTPERRIMLKQDLQMLRQCIDSLPPEYREVLILRELEELSYKEISETAGIAMGTVMSRLNRARTRLEICMAGKEKGIRE